MFPSKTGSLFFVRLATAFIRAERKLKFAACSFIDEMPGTKV